MKWFWNFISFLLPQRLPWLLHWENTSTFCESDFLPIHWLSHFNEEEKVSNLKTDWKKKKLLQTKKKKCHCSLGTKWWRYNLYSFKLSKGGLNYCQTEVPNHFIHRTKTGKAAVVSQSPLGVTSCPFMEVLTQIYNDCSLLILKKNVFFQVTQLNPLSHIYYLSN